MKTDRSGEKAKVQMLIAWHDRATRANLAHYMQAEECQKINSFLTVFNLFAAIVVLYIANNTALLQSMSLSPVLLSISSLAVVLTTALHYVLKLDERMYDHKSAGNEFTAIKRKIERLLIEDNILDVNIREIELDHNHTSKNHHLVRQAVWKKIKPRHEEARVENSCFFECISRMPETQIDRDDQAN